MSLRTRLILALTALAALASTAVGAFALDATGDRLLNEIDRSLNKAGDDVVNHTA